MVSCERVLSREFCVPIAPHPVLCFGGAFSLSSIFLLSELYCPTKQIRSRFLRADDIERNPGPIYAGCSITTRCDRIPTVRTSCRQEVHSFCSGMTRHTKNNTVFVCGFCSGVPPSTATVQLSHSHHFLQLRKGLICCTDICSDIQFHLMELMEECSPSHLLDVCRYAALSSWTGPASVPSAPK